MQCKHAYATSVSTKAAGDVLESAIAPAFNLRLQRVSES
jgi:hypothetical protein